MPGLVLFRWDAPLFFANAEMFRGAIEDAIQRSPTPVRRVVIAAEPVTDIDTTAADVLSELLEALEDAGMELGIAELKGPPRTAFALRPFDRIGEARSTPRSGKRSTSMSPRPMCHGWIGRIAAGDGRETLMWERDAMDVRPGVAVFICYRSSDSAEHADRL